MSQKWDFEEILFKILVGGFSPPPAEILNDLAARYREWIVKMRLMPPSYRRLVIRRLRWLVRILLYSIFFICINEEDEPRMYKRVFSRMRRKIKASTHDVIKNLFFYKYRTDPFGLEALLFGWGEYKKPFRLGFFKNVERIPRAYIRAQILKKKLKLSQRFAYFNAAEVKRYTEATIYMSETTHRYVVANKQALGSGATIDAAIREFANRWRLLALSDFNLRLPLNIYAKQLSLKEIGKVVIIEYDDGTYKPLIQLREVPLHGEDSRANPEGEDGEKLEAGSNRLPHSETDK